MAFKLLKAVCSSMSRRATERLEGSGALASKRGEGLDRASNLGEGLDRASNLGDGLDRASNLGEGLDRASNRGEGLDRGTNLGEGLDRATNLGDGLWGARASTGEALRLEGLERAMTTGEAAVT